MTLSSSCARDPELGHHAGRFQRLERTSTMRGGVHARWGEARVLIVGCGLLGSRLAVELVRSGATAVLVDPEVGEVENLGTQAIRAGVPKVQSVQEDCERVLPGRAEALAEDIRHVGLGTVKTCDLIIDCSDDPELTPVLVEISNGLTIPLLRMALDGTGERELGRVAASHGGAGHACLICDHSEKDLQRRLPRTPCPGGRTEDRPPTLAGGAIAQAVSGLGLLQAQRLLGGREAAMVLDHETIFDGTDLQLMHLVRQRSSDCRSEHRRWDLVFLECDAQELLVVDLLGLARRELHVASVELEPFLHPLCVAAVCCCGEIVQAVGSAWAPRPLCGECGRPMSWLPHFKLRGFNARQARRLGIHDIPLAEIGLPLDGAMITARGSAGEMLRIVLGAARGPNSLQPPARTDR